MTHQDQPRKALPKPAELAQAYPPELRPFALRQHKVLDPRAERTGVLVGYVVIGTPPAAIWRALVHYDNGDKEHQDPRALIYLD